MLSTFCRYMGKLLLVWSLFFIAASWDCCADSVWQIAKTLLGKVLPSSNRTVWNCHPSHVWHGYKYAFSTVRFAGEMLTHKVTEDLTLHFISGVAIAAIHVNSTLSMAPIHSLLWGLAQTVTVLFVSYSRFLFTL